VPPIHPQLKRAFVAAYFLRESVAATLVDAGCTPHQAAAITGPQAIRMLEDYAKQRDQLKLGIAPMPIPTLMKVGKNKTGRYPAFSFNKNRGAP